MFNVGDKIVHPMHGAGTISAIEEKNICNETEQYYIISMPGEVKVMVPIAKAEQIGVRSIIKEDDVQKVLGILEENETEMSNNWNKRYRDNMDKMRSGNIYEVADVVTATPIVSDGKVTVSAACPVEATLYLAVYDQYKNLIAADSHILTAGDMGEDLVAESEEIAADGIYDIKLFMWSADGALTPLTLPIDLTE